jgi:hypothetical protein
LTKSNPNGIIDLSRGKEMKERNRTMTVKELKAILDTFNDYEILTMWGGETAEGDVAIITINDSDDNEETIWQTINGETI